MESGDGLLVRVRAGTRALTSADLYALADLAVEHGNGHIELTRRANLQLRGVRAASAAPLRDALIGRGLVASSAEVEQKLSWLASDALSDVDQHAASARAMTQTLEAMLEGAVLPAALSAKLAIVVDAGSMPSDLRADVRVVLHESLGEQALVCVPAPFSAGIEARVRRVLVPEVVLALLGSCAVLTSDRGAQRMMALDERARARMHAAFGVSFAAAEVGRDLSRREHALMPGKHEASAPYVALAIPFGAGEASTWRTLASFVDAHGWGNLRTTVARTLLVPLGEGANAAKALAEARALGLLVEVNDPRLHIAACVGAPACASALGETRALALSLAATCVRPSEEGVAVHVSGCEKGCAHGGSAGLTVVRTACGGVRVAAQGDVRTASEGPAVHVDALHTRLAARPHNATVAAPMPSKCNYERDGAEIYRRSFAIIRNESRLARFSPYEERIAVRLIHTSGMVDLADDIVFTRTFAEVARSAIQRGAPILCDAKMIVSGITRARLHAKNDVLCFLDHPEVPALARALATTRSAAALDLWRERLDGAVIAIGNAPTALFRLLELFDELNARPSAVIGLPVGFVGAAESKEALIADGRVPAMIVRGRRGGSAMAVAAINALAQDEELP